MYWRLALVFQSITLELYPLSRCSFTIPSVPGRPPRCGAKAAKRHLQGTAEFHRLHTGMLAFARQHINNTHQGSSGCGFHLPRRCT